MNKYYIPEIDIKTIRNHPEIIEKMKKSYQTTEDEEEIILTTNGILKIQDNKIMKFKIITKDSCIVQNFIEKKTLIGVNEYYKRIGEMYHIPYENAVIKLVTIKFFIDKSSTHLVLEKYNNKIHDLYFLTDKKNNIKNRFFIDDVSSFVQSLNV